MTGLGKLLLGTLMAGVLVAGLLMPYAFGAGRAADEIATAVQGAEADALNEPVPLRTTITDAAGNPLALVFEQNRVYRPLAQISDYLQGAVIATEDRRFYSHNGVDWRGTVRAVLVNAQGDATQGGSTLTQQYVKNYLYLVQAQTEAEKADAIAATPIRKLREARMALALESELNSKADILERYLNLVAFGPSTYGAQAASQRFFSVDADQLSLPQAALLAAMINNPNRYNPLDPDRIEQTLTRRNLVLDLMAESGRISQATADQAKAQDLGLNPSTVASGCLPAAGSQANGFFCEYVLDYLENVGIDDVTRGGYTIRTTLDPTVMGQAKAAVDANANPADPNVGRIANVTAVVQRGEPRKVLALAANRPFGLNAEAGQTVQKLTTTFAPLGAGSTFKIFTAAAAMEAGLGTSQTIQVGSEYTSGIGNRSTFNNANENYPATQTLQQALATSPNTGFVRLEESVGLGEVSQMAVKLGLRGYTLPAGEVDPAFANTGTDYAQQVTDREIASFTLGVSPVSPLELANVGATLNSDGRWCPPTPVDTITDRDGRLVSWETQPCEDVLDQGLARTLAVAMEGDFQAAPGARGTAVTAATAAGFTATAAGKTGTTQDYKSSAFLGFTPTYSASVIAWDYLPRPQSICVNPLRSCSTDEAQAGNGMGGGSTPAATWMSMMKPITDGVGDQLFAPAVPQYVTGQPDTQVPSVVGLPVEQAIAQLTAKGYQVPAPQVEQAPGVRANVVIAQEPAVGFAVPGSAIRLTVTAG
ncbi:penicillin-binding protein [Nakamurella leprariae]|nr:transglycosylase domain-containing protein [Nakamurella leprariae]